MGRFNKDLRLFEQRVAGRPDQVQPRAQRQSKNQEQHQDTRRGACCGEGAERLVVLEGQILHWVSLRSLPNSTNSPPSNSAALYTHGYQHEIIFGNTRGADHQPLKHARRLLSHDWRLRPGSPRVYMSKTVPNWPATLYLWSPPNSPTATSMSCCTP